MSSSDPALTPDCARCASLCCVAFPFVVSADFPIRKGAGEPCPNLDPDLRCRVHGALRERGFRGCASYDCFGAGQRVSLDFGGEDWRTRPALAPQMFEAFHRMVQLHALLWHIQAALALPVDAPLRAALDALGARLEPGGPLGALRADANALLLLASAQVRGPGRPLRGAQLLGARLGGQDLRDADLFGAALIGADLRAADLRRADLRGVDLRGADLRGADLRGALFLTQAQLESAQGDARTQLTEPLRHPAHWTGLY